MSPISYRRGRDVLNSILIEKRAGLYAGVDPTAPSLHVGHMLPFMVLAWAYVWGLPVTFLVSDLNDDWGKRSFLLVSALTYG